ncbi:MAG: sulfotransferase [Halioglobus sp.]|nr:sulfotransferase [Halioglobus sp.]
MLGREYSRFDRLLHELALGSSAVAEMSFDIEQMLCKPDVEGMEGAPVFVAGLARAGTTILLRSLYQSGVFRSLTYRDMPFVLMPTTWRRLSAKFRQDMPATERAHGDSITVDYDSPEAFEEVFWRVFYGRDYIFDDHLAPHRLNPAAREQFRRYVASVVGSVQGDGGARYLSKNNNNLLRLSGLQQAFPDATVIVPFREPLQHALSLWRQHRNFSAIHTADAFALKYMNWLGHYEFGLNHKPFRLAGQTLPAASPDAVEYWLAQWIHAYNHALDCDQGGTVFLSYEDLCDDPDGVLARLMTLLDAPYRESIGSRIAPLAGHAAEAVDEPVLVAARQTYQRLLAAKF